jgi:hypothetical protein
MLVIRRKKHCKNIPHVEFVAKLWTEASNPEHTKKVLKTQHKKNHIKKIYNNLFRYNDWMNTSCSSKGLEKHFLQVPKTTKPPNLIYNKPTNFLAICL